MIHEDDIVGLTLSEIAFVLLFFLLAQFVILSREHHNNLSTSKEDLKTIKHKLSKANHEIWRLKQKGMKSRQLPTCRAAKLADSFLFDVEILGKDLFRVDDKEYSFRQIVRTYSKDIERARGAECRHSIRVSCSRQIEVESFDHALRKLERHFYIKRIPIGAGQ